MIDRHLGCFQLRDIMNKAAVIILVQVFGFGCLFWFWFLWTSVSCNPYSHIILELLGYIVKYIFMKYSQTVFQNCTILHPHQQYMRVPVAPHPLQHLVSSIFLISLISRWEMLSQVLICISFMPNNITHSHVGTGHSCIFCEVSVHVFAQRQYYNSIFDSNKPINMNLYDNLVPISKINSKF